MPTKQQYRDRKSLGICTDCGKRKAIKTTVRCKPCKLQHNQYNKSYSSVNRSNTQRKYRLKTLTAQRADRLRRKYNVSIEEIDELVLQKQNKCDICGNIIKKMNIDHKNVNGIPIIRGLLCMFCNVGLGHFRDNTDILLSAIRYLQLAESKGIK